MDSQWTVTAPSEQAKSAWEEVPHYWRYRQGNQTLGALLLGHPQQPMTTSLAHALFLSLDEVGDPGGFLVGGAMYTMPSRALQSNSKPPQVLARWDEAMGYLRRSGHIKIFDAPLVLVETLLADLQFHVQTFHQSSQYRTILYYHWPEKSLPLVLPLLTIDSPVQPARLQFSLSKRNQQILTALGQIFYRQRLYRSLALFKVLLTRYYEHNKKVHNTMFPAQLKCSYEWYRLFHLRKQKIYSRRVNIYLEQANPANPSQSRRLMCNATRLVAFSQAPPVFRQLRKLRTELGDLNDTFREYVDYHGVALRRLTAYDLINLSTALDGLLRQYVLPYNGKVSLRGKLTDPNEFFATWAKGAFREMWRSVHKVSQEDGRFLETVSTQPAGIFSRDHTIFWVTRQGLKFLINPHVILQGKFAVVLDRARGIIEVLSPSKVYPFVAKRAFPPPPAQTSSSQATRPSLRQMIEQSSTKGLTIVHAAYLKDIPMPPPEIPQRSFLIRDGFLWIRLEHTLTVIPIFGANAISATLQQKIVQKVEAEMRQQDAIAQHIKVLSIQNNEPELLVTFPKARGIK